MRKTVLLTLFLSLALVSCGRKDKGDADAGFETKVARVAPPAGKQWSDVVAQTADGGYRMGNPDAAIKLIEYGSRSCSHCAAFARQGEPVLRAKYVETGKVSYEFRDMVRNGPDVAAMLVGECAGPEQFFPILAEMFAARENLLNRLKPEYAGGATPGQSVGQQAIMIAEGMGYMDFVTRRGVTVDAAHKCLSDSAKIDAVEKRLNKATTDYDIQTTPTFIVNGHKVEAGNWPQLEPRLQDAGA